MKKQKGGKKSLKKNIKYIKINKCTKPTILEPKNLEK